MRSRKIFSLGWAAVILIAIFIGRSVEAQAGEIQTPWTSITRNFYPPWKLGHVYHITGHLAPSVSGTRPEPPVTAVVASGKCRVSHFTAKLWKPGRSNFLLVNYDYVPLDAATLHPHIIHLLNKSGGVASEMTYIANKN